MKDQHTKISGYRSLTQEEIDLMNEAKDLEASCLDLADRVAKRLLHQSANEEAERVADSKAYRWHNIGCTDIEKGFMALVRSIAQPLPRK